MTLDLRKEPLMTSRLPLGGSESHLDDDPELEWPSGFGGNIIDCPDRSRITISERRIPAAPRPGRESSGHRQAGVSDDDVGGAA